MNCRAISSSARWRSNFSRPSLEHARSSSKLCQPRSRPHGWYSVVRTQSDHRARRRSRPIQPELGAARAGVPRASTQSRAGSAQGWSHQSPISTRFGGCPKWVGPSAPRLGGAREPSEPNFDPARWVSDHFGPNFDPARSLSKVAAATCRVQQAEKSPAGSQRARLELDRPHPRVARGRIGPGEERALDQRRDREAEAGAVAGQLEVAARRPVDLPLPERELEHVDGCVTVGRDVGQDQAQGDVVELSSAPLSN